MKGFVPTPPALVDAMVDKLFRERRPESDDRLLDPGCGTGAFIHGILRWCERSRSPVPHIVGIDSDNQRLVEARRGLSDNPRVTLRLADFLQPSDEKFDFIIGNPPYVSITGLSVQERNRYRECYSTARGRFDLYLLFFEQAIESLKRSGRLVFVTPEKFLYTQSADALRRRLADVTVEEIELIEEGAFGNLVTYPAVTTVLGKHTGRQTKVRLRDGAVTGMRIDRSGSSWLPRIRNQKHQESNATLSDVFARISCGVATGADDVFVVDGKALPNSLREFAYPTISGKQITPGQPVRTSDLMLVPYAANGTLLPESALGSLRDYLKEPERYGRLMQRTCVSRKPWYAFHETPPLCEILVPKILCKDIGRAPAFVLDNTGEIVPRHSVYYLVPRDPSHLYELWEYVNSPEASDWLMAHCQRAANGFVRLQSHTLKCLPLPKKYLQQLILQAG